MNRLQISVLLDPTIDTEAIAELFSMGEEDYQTFVCNAITAGIRKMYADSEITVKWKWGGKQGDHVTVIFPHIDFHELSKQAIEKAIAFDVQRKLDMMMEQAHEEMRDRLLMLQDAVTVHL